MLDDNLNLFVANILKNYFQYSKISNTDWNKYGDNFVKVLNSPSPTITFFITDILTQQKVPIKFSKEILKNGSITIKEILNGQHSDIDFYKQKIYPFLSYLTKKDFNSNTEKWLGFIEDVGK